MSRRLVFAVCYAVTLLALVGCLFLLAVRG